MILLDSFLTILSAFQTVSQGTCPRISMALGVGTVTAPQVNEASGLVASQANAEVFWTLNDSQGPVCVYALAMNGSLLHTICLEGALNYDWEAISIAPCAINSKEFCIYIGDIGDNRYVRDFVSIFKIKEPRIEANMPQETTTSDWDVIHLQYPNGQKFNAESMLVDRKLREIIIVTKSKIPPYALVFKAPLDLESGDTHELLDTEIRLSLPDATDATASEDGQVVMVRLYVGAFLWPRRTRGAQTSIVDILREDECLVSVGIQDQGESVALTADGSSYFTHSEFVNQSIWRYDIHV